MKYDLAVTGTNLASAYDYDTDTKTILSHFKVFARMTPDAKETVTTQSEFHVSCAVMEPMMLAH